MTELGNLSVQDLAAGVRSGELTALDIVEDCLERTTGTLEPRVSAYLALYEDEARQTASAIDRRRDAGEALGPLAGIRRRGHRHRRQRRAEQGAGGGQTHSRAHCAGAEGEAGG